VVETLEAAPSRTSPVHSRSAPVHDLRRLADLVRRHRHAVAFGVFVMLIGGLYLSVLLGDRSLITNGPPPSGPLFVGDPLAGGPITFPLERLESMAWAHLQYPVINPYQAYGVPLLSDQGAPVYPLQVIAHLVFSLNYSIRIGSLPRCPRLHERVRGARVCRLDHRCPGAGAVLGGWRGDGYREASTPSCPSLATEALTSRASSDGSAAPVGCACRLRPSRLRAMQARYPRLVRAALYDTTGSARDVLRVSDISRPEPGPGEVRVRVEVSGVNPTDWKSRSGVTSRGIDEFQVPNQDGAGVIDAVGAGVDERRIGERVWIWLAAAGRRWGTAAEWTVVPSGQAVSLPNGASADLGASLGVPAMTAHHCLFADGPVSGQTVLVSGGAGAVGHFAIELAKWGGARVITTVSSAAKAKLAGQAGADLVVNYREQDVAAELRRFSGQVDRIVEVNLAANLELDAAVSRPGTAVVVYAADGPDPVLPVRTFMTANLTLEFVLLYGVERSSLNRYAADINRAIGDGALSELPAHRFSLDEVAAAHEAVEQGAVGKVLIDLA
jgi:NADPH2:quinone reductase